MNQSIDMIRQLRDMGATRISLGSNGEIEVDFSTYQVQQAFPEVTTPAGSTGISEEDYTWSAD